MRHCFVVENRTGEPAELAYVDRATAWPCRTVIAPGEAVALDGDPAGLKWLNVPPEPPPFLSAVEADALDAAREAGSPPWRGLAHRTEPATLAEVGGR